VQRQGPAPPIRNYAKITVIANKFPQVDDDSLAFRERRIFISFPNEFTGEKQIQNVERVWLDDRQERSGILNWMLEGLKRLLSQGYFTESRSQAQTEIAFERASDTIRAFITEMAIFDKNRVTTRTEAYEAYKRYCDVHGLENESDKKFTQKLKNTPRVSVSTVPPNNQRAWKGLGLKQLNDEGSLADLTHLSHFEESTLDESQTIQISPSASDQKSVKSVNGPFGESPEPLAKDCIHFHLASCSHPNPTCLTPLNPCPSTCRSFGVLPSFEDKCETPEEAYKE
jgi:hypothetical protein